MFSDVDPQLSTPRNYTLDKTMNSCADKKFCIFREQKQQAVEIQDRLKREQCTACIARQCLARLYVQQGQAPGYEDQ